MGLSVGLSVHLVSRPDVDKIAVILKKVQRFRVQGFRVQRPILRQKLYNLLKSKWLVF